MTWDLLVTAALAALLTAAAMRVAARRSAASQRVGEDDGRTVLDRIPGFVHTLTPAGEVEHVNKRIIDFFGIPADELRDWTLVTHPDDIAPVGALLEGFMRAGAPYELESRARRADGVYRWLHSRGVPWRDSDGKILRWYACLTDIDDRKHAEEALRASEHRLRLMVESIPGFICTANAAGEIEYVNKRICDFTGKTLEELRDWSRVVHVDDLSMVAEVWQRSVATGEKFLIEFRLRRADGVYRWFQWHNVALRGEDGQIERWYSLLSDIEDRKQAEERLSMREKELAQIIETLPACIWCASPDGKVIYVNNRVLEYTGASFEEIKSDSFNHIHPDDREVVVDAWMSAARNETPYETLYRKRRADGSFHWVQSIGRLGRDEHGNADRWYGLFIDVNQRVQAEEALRDTRARLARATQLATAGELAAAIAHEINQPLAAVLAHAHACNSWLTAEPPNLPRALLTLQRIMRDGKSAGDVIEKTRALYRHALPIKELLNINEVIEESCHLIEAETRRRSVMLRTSLDSELPLVPADRMQLQQVLTNLTRNAMEAMEPVADRPKQLRIASIQENDRVIVEVQDNGVGAADFSAAFEPFFTTKPHGMGMGLAICRSIVEGHGGRLWAVRAAPFGAVFSFSLPLSQDAKPVYAAARTGNVATARARSSNIA